MAKFATDRYAGLPKPLPDAVFSMNQKAKDDKRGINLVIGAYRDENGKPKVLDTVRKAEQMIVQKNLYKEYQSIDGHKEFCTESVKLLLGEDSPPLEQIARVQALSGTGAVRLAAELMEQTLSLSTPVYLSKPTWPNHVGIFEFSNFHRIVRYRYFDPKTGNCDFRGMIEDLANAPMNSIVVFHLCAHNPTGADPTPQQWEEIAEICITHHFNVIFDCAYQGYASGDLSKDAFAARLFARKGIEFLSCQSYSKNMGLYGERVGCLCVVCGSAASAALVQGLLKNIIRPMYSNPPLGGVRIAHLILSDAQLRQEWELELKGMSDRITEMRQLLYAKLVELKTPGKWDHIITQIGMFSYLGLTPEQCARLRNEFHIYLMPTGRASIAGLTVETAPKLAIGIDAVVRGIRPSKL